MIGNAPLSPFTGCPGWESISEQELLLELAQTVPQGGVIVEIGGEFGMSASMFCLGAHKSVKIMTVDLFPGELLKQHQSNLTEAGFEKRSDQWQGNSRDAAQKWHDAAIDLLFLDGDHSYEGVLADLNNWTPFVKAGGVVVLHDVAVDTNRMPHPLHYEVKRALDAWQNKQPTQVWKVDRSVDSTVVLQRVGIAVKWETPQTKVYDDGSFEVAGKHPLDDERTLSKQAAPAELTPTTDMVNVDDEVHAPVDPEIYDEPKEQPRRRTRTKSKK